MLGLGLYADFGSLGDELASFRWELFPLALALTALNYLLRFFRWQRYLAKVGIEVPAGRSLSIFVAGLTMTVTPAKLGELLKSGLLKRGLRRAGAALGAGRLAERATDATGVVVLAVVGGARPGATGRCWWPRWSPSPRAVSSSTARCSSASAGSAKRPAPPARCSGRGCSSR